MLHDCEFVIKVHLVTRGIIICNHISIFVTFCLNFQLLEPPEPSFPPPPPPSAPAPASDWNTPQTEGGDWNNDAWNSHGTDSWDQEAPHAPDFTNHNNVGGVNNQGFRGGGVLQQASEEGWDDDWDDENEDNSSNSTTNTSQVKSSPWFFISLIIWNGECHILYLLYLQI